MMDIDVESTAFANGILNTNWDLELFHVLGDDDAGVRRKTSANLYRIIKKQIACLLEKHEKEIGNLKKQIKPPPALHRLKIKDDHWRNVISGIKTFEVRINDRNYQRGDKIIFLSELGGNERGYGRDVFEITYVQSGYGINENFVVFGIELIKKEEL